MKYLLLRQHQGILHGIASFTSSLYLLYHITAVLSSPNNKHKRGKLVSTAGTEELAHLEMISAIISQLTQNLSIEEIKKSGFDKYFVDHTAAVYPVSASGMPFTATYFQSKGDPITDLHENMAAEQKARTTYDNILRLADDPDVIDPIRFLREREIVHYQRFGEALRLTQDQLDSRNFYACNPSFDKNCKRCRGCQK